MNRIPIGKGRCAGCGQRLPGYAVTSTQRAWSQAPLCSTCDRAALEAWERRQAGFTNRPRVVVEPAPPSRVSFERGA